MTSTEVRSVTGPFALLTLNLSGTGFPVPAFLSFSAGGLAIGLEKPVKAYTTS